MTWIWFLFLVLLRKSIIASFCRYTLFSHNPDALFSCDLMLIPILKCSIFPESTVLFARPAKICNKEKLVWNKYRFINTWWVSIVLKWPSQLNIIFLMFYFVIFQLIICTVDFTVVAFLECGIWFVGIISVVYMPFQSSCLFMSFKWVQKVTWKR